MNIRNLSWAVFYYDDCGDEVVLALCSSKAAALAHKENIDTCYPRGYLTFVEELTQ